MSNLSEAEFTAWIDKMPGSQPNLIVQGTIEVPTSGWNATLIPVVPQGINEHVLILDLKLKKPTGIVNQVMSRIKCRYEESPPKHEYTDATIISEGNETTIKVREVE